MRASTNCLVGLGLSKGFIEKLRGYANLVCIERDDPRYTAALHQVIQSEDCTLEYLMKKISELKEHFLAQVQRTPLLFDRAKSEKHLMVKYIRSYYEPIIKKNDVIFGD